MFCQVGLLIYIQLNFLPITCSGFRKTRDKAELTWPPALEQFLFKLKSCTAMIPPLRHSSWLNFILSFSYGKDFTLVYTSSTRDDRASDEQNVATEQKREWWRAFAVHNALVPGVRLIYVHSPGHQGSVVFFALCLFSMLRIKRRPWLEWGRWNPESMVETQKRP